MRPFGDEYARDGGDSEGGELSQKKWRVSVNERILAKNYWIDLTSNINLASKIDLTRKDRFDQQH